MNLMFRKNFREGASKSGGGGGKLQSKANRTKRSRDMGLVQQPEEIHYRTHLFFSPNRPGYDVGEERCSALSGIPGTPTTSTSFTLPNNPYEVDVPQPLVDRSVSLLRWNSTSGSGSGGNNSTNNSQIRLQQLQPQQQQQQQHHAAYAYQQQQLLLQQQQQQQQTFSATNCLLTAAAAATRQGLSPKCVLELVVVATR